MECGRSSSLSVEDGNRRGSAFGRQEVLYSPLAPQRDDRRMLKQQKHTRMRTPYYPFLYLSLNLVCRQVGSLSLIHISEPTRLRRISYAVFCLKKKKKKNKI